MNNQKSRGDEESSTRESQIENYFDLDKSKQDEIAHEGDELLQTGRLDEAESIYRGLVEASPDDSVFRCQLGSVYFRKQDFEGAFREFDRSIRLNDANVDALAARGELYLMRQEYELAILDLKHAVEYDPEGTRQSSIRARAILLSLRDAMEDTKSSDTSH